MCVGCGQKYRRPTQSTPIASVDRRGRYRPKYLRKSATQAPRNVVQVIDSNNIPASTPEDKKSNTGENT